MKAHAPPGSTEGFTFMTKRVFGPGLNFFSSIAFAFEPEIRKDLADKPEFRKKIIIGMKKLVAHYVIKDASLKYKCRELQEMSPDKYIEKLEDDDY
mmetsp:Transcript_10000/g.8522  ORF Transcript_10000/g.8522 Transcript_10000/m.8522 type:complete len:96 (-) Transcript_10000:464-751(-)